MSCRLLIVDDNRDSANSLALVFSGRHEVRTAYDGEGALALALEFAPDVAILDIMMPRMSGYRVGEILRERHPECEIIFFSGASTHEQTFSLGFKYHILKPVDPNELLRLVGEKCRGK